VTFWAHSLKYRVKSRIKRVLTHNRYVILNLLLFHLCRIFWQALVILVLSAESVIESHDRISTSLPTSKHHGVFEVLRLILIYWHLFWYLVLDLDLMIVAEPVIDSLYLPLLLGLVQEGLTDDVTHVKHKAY
jgi:hypothetical protein